MSGDGTVPGQGTDPYQGGVSPYGSSGENAPTPSSTGPYADGAYAAAPYPAAPYADGPYPAAPYPAAPYGSVPAAPYGDPAWQGYVAPGQPPADPYAGYPSTDPNAGYQYAPGYVPGYSAYPPAPVRNSQATAGLVLGIIAMVVNPLTVLSILGIVFSGIGLSRAGTLVRLGYPPVGRTAATWGLVLSILALGFTALFKLFLF